MHWIALPLPWRDEPAASPANTGAAAAAGTMAAPAAGWWALRFTPRVALVDGDTVLLEVSTTERLWGGRDALLALVLQVLVLPDDVARVLAAVASGVLTVQFPVELDPLPIERFDAGTGPWGARFAITRQLALDGPAPAMPSRSRRLPAPRRGSVHR